MALVVLLLALLPAPAALAGPPGGGGTLVFRDNFNGTALNTSRWETKYGGRSGQMQYANPKNGEAQWYKARNCIVRDGILRQRARRELTLNPFTGTLFRYSSCIITSRPSFSFRRGYMEARVRVPRGSGFWPAFWTWPRNEQWPPEIDAFEFWGDRPNMLSLKYHGLRVGGGRYSSATQISNRDWTAGWHTVGVDWRPGRLAWYVDGVRRKVVADEPRLSMYLIANLAICSGAHCPAPKLSTPFPSDHRIDYIRVWKR